MGPLYGKSLPLSSSSSSLSHIPSLRPDSIVLSSSSSSFLIPSSHAIPAIHHFVCLLTCFDFIVCVCASLSLSSCSSLSITSTSPPSSSSSSYCISHHRSIPSSFSPPSPFPSRSPPGTHSGSDPAGSAADTHAVGDRRVAGRLVVGQSRREHGGTHREPGHNLNLAGGQVGAQLEQRA